jgi:hypothetical protein
VVRSDAPILTTNPARQHGLADKRNYLFLLIFLVMP